MTGSVSVVMPAFNEELGITASVRAVRAALDATDTAYELLVIDDEMVSIPLGGRRLQTG